MISILFCLSALSLQANVDNYHSIALQHMKDGQFEEAILALNQGLETDSLFVARNHNDLGFCYYKVQAYERALQHLNFALKADPTYLGECYNGGIYFKLGLCYDALEQPEKALQFYEKQIFHYANNGAEAVDCEDHFMIDL